MSKLEDVSAPFRKTEVARNMFNYNDEYSLGNAEELSPIGKGENNGEVGSAVDIATRKALVAKNPYNYVLSNEDLNNIKAEDLVSNLHQLTNFKQDVIYYGPQPLVSFATNIAKLHTLPSSFTPTPSAVSYKPVQQTENKVLFAQYDMVQAEIRWLRNADYFDVTTLPTIDVFNNYFGGGGMSGIVFQTIRESKALAYSTFAVYNKPVKKENPYTFIAYVGTQADKLNDAIKSMNELINDLPKADKLLEDSKKSVKKDIESERITDEAVIFNYLENERLGITTDTRKGIYTAVDKISFEDIKSFTQNEIASKPYTYCIVASDKKINVDDLKQYGEVKRLSLEELFGY
jgi:hypothetical protein